VNQLEYCIANNVTLLPMPKGRGFFRLSSVRGMRRNGAWLRLVAHRSGGGKARKQYLHSDSLFPGRCHARCTFHALHKGKNGPQLVVGILERNNTHVFRRLTVGNFVPSQGGGFPYAILLQDATLPKAL
jgi:hypothetical protein